MRVRNDGGQSLIEAIVLGLLVLVPVLWAIGVLADLHRTALATTAAAREAGFEAARSPNAWAAEHAASDAVVVALDNHGLEADRADVSLSLDGFTRGATVEVEVSYPVAVMQAPLLGRIAEPAIEIHAAHSAIVDPYRSRP